MKLYKFIPIIISLFIITGCDEEEENNFDLSGTWFTDNAFCAGTSDTREVINITHTKDSIIAIKTVSIGCVSVGEVSFHGPNVLIDDSYYEITWATGTINNPNCCTAPGRIEINQEECTFEAFFQNKPLKYLRDANQIEYSIPGDFYLIRQPSDYTCWAAATTMMISWLDQVRYSIEDVLQSNPAYLQQFKDDQGLRFSQVEEFINLYEMIDIPFCGDAACFKDLLKKHGPLLVVTTNALSDNSEAHARILTAIRGDGNDNCTYMEFYDPARGGFQKVDTYSEFEQKYKNLAQNNFPQIIGFSN